MKNTYIYNSKFNSKNLVVINHGASEDIRSEFITKISDKAYNAGFDTLTIQMPYKDRGEGQTTSKELTEEIAAVKSVIESINLKSYDKIHFVGKSLGGLILLNYIYQNRDSLPAKFDITFLGFLVEFTILKSIEGMDIKIIQGSLDKYGTKQQIENIIQQNSKLKIDVKYIDNADHSYRNTAKEPVFQDDAIELIKFD